MSCPGLRFWIRRHNRSDGITDRYSRYASVTRQESLQGGGAWLGAAEQLVAKFTASDVEAGRLSVATDGLQGQLAGHSVHELAKAVLDIAEAGLKSRAICDDKGQDETKFLDPLQKIVQLGKTHADVMLEQYHSSWGEDIHHIFKEYHY